MRTKIVYVVCLLTLFLLTLCFQVAKERAASSIMSNSIDNIIYDMQPPHEGIPRGVPSSYDWVLGPRLGKGNNPGNFQAAIAWGQLYEASEGNPASNTRVQFKDIKMYMLSKRNGRWRLLQNSRQVHGAAYREDFIEDINRPADIRLEQDGTISVKAGGGYNFHFWPQSGRVAIAPSDVGGIFTTVQARLIVDDPAKPLDLDRARYLLSMGGDYWLNLTTFKDRSRPTAGDIAIGKFKYVTAEWKSFNMITLSPAKVRKNPPPL